jgi:hypothetical protein
MLTRRSPMVALMCLACLFPLAELTMADEPTNPMLRMQQLYGGGLVRDAKTAERLASVLISSLYGEDELAEQMPLQVSDMGDAWRVVGSRTPKGPPGDLRLKSGIGSVTIVINKSDAKVVDLRLEYRMPVDPAVESLIRQKQTK